ncbi:PKD domain-containing protein [Parabacteroides sp. PF5-9]|uniref:PKD domain-containing protein n=1 Tax=Parabacteroides sp. PF5-9 TaxID=1742404 RepID=UPI00247523FE|nr:PKD domain-containing protein [Parabacteroides sp. PF5-9]MDH6357184.1 hypothetical protein [Parabacteroides sp. PF5-9]
MKSMKTLCFICLSAMTVFSVQAQKEAGHWYFGHNVGLNFIDTQTVNDKNGVPVDGMPTLETGPISTNEGCFSLSDSDGNLIVASDGMRVYNKNKDVIATGLYGNTSSAQSGILIPFPENPGKYIIISNNCRALHYSIFDANANGGLGEVTNINTPVQQTTVGSSQLYENVTSQIHANGKDYWLLHRAGPYFFTWLITKDGISTTPIVTDIPDSKSQISGLSEGYMKMSPDGKKICHANLDAPEGEVFFADFDNKTGKISNIILRYWKFDTIAFYSLEFSPLGKNLFLSELNKSLYVIPVEDIELGTPTLVTTEIGTVQTGSDGRLYGIRSSGSATKRFGVIPNPDDPIEDIKVHIFENFLNGSGAIWGLPTFAANWFSVSIDADESFCVNTSQDFTVTINQSGSQQITYTEWDFGEGGSFLKDTNVSSGTQTHSYTYEKPGMYNITVRSYLADGKEVASETITVKVNPCVLPVNPNVHLFK